MKNIFNNPVVRMVRDEVNDLRKKNKDTKTDQEIPAGPPAYCHHPPSTSSSTTTTTDSYSHTASSTAGYSQTNAYPTLTTHNQERDRQSFLGKIESTTTNLLGNVIGQDTVVSVAHKLNTAVTTGRNARELLRNGAVVQLVSKSAGSLLQVVMSTNGVLIFDGNGAANSFNTYFTVEEAEKGRLRFHNNYNYLAFEGKLACIMSFPPGAKNNTSIDFRVHDILGTSELVALESCAYKNHFISISPDGLLKTTNIKDKNIDAQFSVVSIISNQQMMYPQQTQPHQLYNMSPYSSIPSMDSQPSSMYHEQSQSLYPQPPKYHEQSQPLYPQPPMYQQQQQPPPSTSLENSSYATQSPYNQSTTSSSLYPKFN
ncbi:unnamed protein product [Adineta steineri]|uniref:Uncharacterized protein n=1 Tax=Adineta steineri TaxID=433720 RepID=A0A816BPD4_9BILA|nr:unnamed protein product [Adineta steineri]CAF1614121.1 unnamed protein product [Adineta steineri]